MGSIMQRQFSCSSPATQAVLRDIRRYHWGIVVYLIGAKDQLIAAGFDQARFYRGPVREFHDEFGDTFSIYRELYPAKGKPKRWEIEHHIKSQLDDSAPS